MATYPYRMPLKLRSKASMNPLITAAERQRARSAAYHASRRAQQMVRYPYSSTSAQAGSTTMALYARPASEVNYFDQLITNPSTLTLWSVPAAFAEPAGVWAGITCINEVNQGTAAYNRVGNKIVIKSIAFSCDLITNNTATVQTVSRTLLVYDKQCNGTAPVLADILYSDPTASTQFTSGVNMRNKSRYLIIRDQYDTFDVTGNTVRNIKMYCKGRWETEFKANTGPPGVIGDIATGAIYLIAFVGNGGGAGSVVMRDAMSRIRFYP